MKKGFIFIYICIFCNMSFAQVQQLREFKAEGHTFKELYQKADQLIPKHKLDNPEFRKAFREGKLDGVFLMINEFLWNVGPGTGAIDLMKMVLLVTYPNNQNYIMQLQMVLGI